jgi:GNAT superfamily N-acetyltransferase
MEIIYKQVNSENELHQLLALQAANHKSILSDIEKEEQGFVTVKHLWEEINALHTIEKSTIAVYDNQVIGYTIAMTSKSRNDIPVLVPMFEVFDSLEFNNKSLASYQYMVCGQVCVDKSFRGLGVFANNYLYYKSVFEKRYSFCVTEIDVKNTRSLKAHQKLGFEIIHTFQDKFGIEWAIVLWPW